MSRTRLSVLVGFVLVAVSMSPAQNQQKDLKTLLQDVAYVLNRFEEVTTGLDVQIRHLDTSTSAKESFVRAWAAVSRNVEAEKPKLNALLGRTDVTSTDLFDVYSEIVEVTSELMGESSYFECLGSETKAMELAQLGAKAMVLGGNLGAALRSQLSAQQVQLTDCSLKQRSAILSDPRLGP